MDVTPPSQHELVRFEWHEQFLSDRAEWTKDARVASHLAEVVIICALAIFILGMLLRRKNASGARLALVFSLFLSGAGLVGLTIAEIGTGPRVPSRPRADQSYLVGTLDSADLYFKYPELTSPELLIRAGEPTTLVLRNSTEKSCSLSIPGWHMRVTVAPHETVNTVLPANLADLATEAVLEADGPGCSTTSLRMARALAANEYDRVTAAPPGPLHPLSPVQRGEKRYHNKCEGCHSVDGSRQNGPTFEGLFGRRVTLSNGIAHTVDENFVRWAILKNGEPCDREFACTMPSFAGRLSEKDIDGIIAFLKEQSTLPRSPSEASDPPLPAIKPQPPGGNSDSRTVEPAPSAPATASTKRPLELERMNTACEGKAEGDLCRKRPTDELDGVCVIDEYAETEDLYASRFKCDPFAPVAAFAEADARGPDDKRPDWRRLGIALGSFFGTLLLATVGGTLQARVNPLGSRAGRALVVSLSLGTALSVALAYRRTEPRPPRDYSLGAQLAPAPTRDICSRHAAGFEDAGFSQEISLLWSDLLPATVDGRDIVLARGHLWPAGGAPVIGDYTLALGADSLELLWWSGPCGEEAWSQRAVTPAHAVIFDQRGLAHILSIDRGIEQRVIALGSRVHAAAGIPGKEEVWFDTSDRWTKSLMGILDLETGAIRAGDDVPESVRVARVQATSTDHAHEPRWIRDIRFVTNQGVVTAWRGATVVWSIGERDLWLLGTRVYTRSSDALLRIDPETGVELARFGRSRT